MKKLWLAFGLLLLLLGLILVSISGRSEEKTPSYDVVGFSEKSWQVDGIFRTKDSIVIHIGPGENWYMFFNDPSVMVIRSFNLTISGSGKALFNVSISGPDPKYNPDLGLWVPLCLADVELVHGDNLDGAVSAEIVDPTMIRLGVIKDSGLYTARIDKEYWMIGPGGDDPPTLGLYKRISEQNFPYGFLLPVGSSFGIVGVVVAVWGVVASKPRKSSRLKLKR